MPILLTEREQCELRPGGNPLGGDAPDAVVLSDLATAPLAGTIMVRPDGPPMIQRLSSGIALMVDGIMLGPSPARLTNGSMIQVGRVRLRYYEHTDAAQAAAPDVPRRRKELDFATQVMTAISEPVESASLIALATGRIIRLPSSDVVIGRGEEADLRLTGNGVSRHHATLHPEGGTYAIIDASTNGTFVNGTRVSGRTRLKAGDTLAFGDEAYRFDTIDAAHAERSGGGNGTRASGATPLAELDVVRGRAARKTYPIGRAVCSLGRSPHNDVAIDDESISPSHATLMLKGDTWYLTDLRSAAGTYVDGYRVAGERALAAGAVITIGQVSLEFRPRAGGAPAAPKVRKRGVFRKLARALFS